jgi:hypothetical protein
MSFIPAIRSFLMGFTVAAAPCLAVTAVADITVQGEIEIIESFETGFGPWTFDTQVYGEQPFDPRVERVSDQAHTGHTSIFLSALGYNDNGALWLERSITLPAGTYDLGLTVWLYSFSEAPIGAWSVVSQIGTANPEFQDEFEWLDPANLQIGWRPYPFRRQITLTETGRVWFASGLRINFESEAGWHFDDYTIEISPAVQTPGDVDGDFDIDLSDLARLLATFGRCTADPGFDPPADFDADGCITLADLSTLLSNFGA